MKTHRDPKFASLNDNKYENFANYLLKTKIKAIFLVLKYTCLRLQIDI